MRNLRTFVRAAATLGIIAFVLMAIVSMGNAFYEAVSVTRDVLHVP